MASNTSSIWLSGSDPLGQSNLARHSCSFPFLSHFPSLGCSFATILLLKRFWSCPCSIEHCTRHQSSRESIPRLGTLGAFSRPEIKQETIYLKMALFTTFLKSSRHFFNPHQNEVICLFLLFPSLVGLVSPHEHDNGLQGIAGNAGHDLILVSEKL